MIKSLLTAIIIMFYANCFGQETKTFNKHNITFEYPKHWIVRDFPQTYILISEPPKDEMSVMTTFDVEVETGYESIKQYLKSYEKKMKKIEQFKDCKMKKKKVHFHGIMAYEYACSASTSFLPIEWKSIVFMKNYKIYKLSTCSMIGQFYLQKETTQKIFNSFKIE